jgi:hypothetical protein
VIKGDGGFELRETIGPYNNLFEGEKGGLRFEKGYIWKV